jgi:hypothetical protein
VEPERLGGLVFAGGLFFAAAGVAVGVPSGEVQAGTWRAMFLRKVSVA